MRPKYERNVENLTTKKIPEPAKVEVKEYSAEKKLEQKRAVIETKENKVEEGDNVAPLDFSISNLRLNVKSKTEGIPLSVRASWASKDDLPTPLQQLQNWLLEQASDEIVKAKKNDEKVRWLKFACQTELLSTLHKTNHHSFKRFS